MVDPYINTQGIQTDSNAPYAGQKARSKLNVSTSYVLLMPERAGRVGYEIEADTANAGTVSIRYGATGDEFQILPGGSHMRSKSTGGVYAGEIYVKSSTATDDVIAREW